MIDGKEKIKKNIFQLNNEKNYKQDNLDGQDLKNFFIQEFSASKEEFISGCKINKKS